MILAISSKERFQQLRKIAGDDSFAHDLIDTLEALQGRYKSAAEVIKAAAGVMLDDMKNLELLPPTVSVPYGSVRTIEPGTTAIVNGKEYTVTGVKLDHINCPCWKTGKFVWVDGCKDHPWLV
jgi:hypothetical protein